MASADLDTDNNMIHDASDNSVSVTNGDPTLALTGGSVRLENNILLANTDLIVV